MEISVWLQTRMPIEYFDNSHPLFYNPQGWRQIMTRMTARKSESASIENPPGVVRTTIAYNDQLMLCHFSLKKGAKIPLHQHEAIQNGYLISGKMRMLWQTGEQFLAGPGDGWCFNSNESHGAEIIEDSEAIECFTPCRPEYTPK
jgi:quercetin dioxygenase-like cupin family protein